VPQLQEVWNKLNPRERLTAIGAGLVVLAWLIGIVARGFGVNSLGLLGAIAVIVVLFLKYAPNMNITWPIPVPLITLGISAIVAILAILTLVDWLGYIELLSATAIISFALYVIGAIVMLWGSFQEYQVEKPAMPNFSSGTGTGTGSGAAPTAAPPAATPTAAPPPAAAPTTPTAAPPPASDSDDLPPA
jgi:hypothetical protein